MIHSSKPCVAGCEKSYPCCQEAEREDCFVGVSFFVLAPASTFEDRAYGRVNALELTPAATFEAIGCPAKVSVNITFDQAAIASIYIFRHSRHLTHLIALVWPI